jgi:hypothetical protein
MDGAVDAPPPMATLPTVRASLIFHLCDYEPLSDMFLPTFLCRQQEESPSASAALSPQRKSERDRTHSMKGSALIASTSPRPPMSVKERVDAHRNRDTLERRRPTASHAEAQRAYRERCRPEPPPPPPPVPVCKYRPWTCLAVEHELRYGRLPVISMRPTMCDVCRKKKDALVCHRRCRGCQDAGEGNFLLVVALVTAAS